MGRAGRKHAMVACMKDDRSDKFLMDPGSITITDRSQEVGDWLIPPAMPDEPARPKAKRKPPRKA
jgi:hypothetical protein